MHQGKRNLSVAKRQHDKADGQRGYRFRSEGEYFAPTINLCRNKYQERFLQVVPAVRYEWFTKTVYYFPVMYNLSRCGFHLPKLN